MSFTKVAPAGIGTEPGSEIRIGDSLLHSTGLDIGTGSGIGVTIRQHGDATFTGIITASAFFGDGSGLEGVSSSGIGTPLSDDDTSDLNKIYYVNQELSIGSTVTVNHPDSAVASYTHYQDLVVTDDADFIVADGDTFIPDVLGIRTSTSTASAATGGRIRAGTITNAGANGAVNFPNGLVATSATFTGVLTYEDVTNVDSVGVITARQGIRIGTGGTVGPSGSGIVTYFGDGSQLTGIDATKIETGNTKVETVDTGSDGHVKITTEGSERLRIINNGKIFVGAYSAGDDFSDEGTFFNLRNNTYGGRIGFSNNTATAGVALMEQFAYWGNNKVAGMIISAGTDTSNKDDASMTFYTRNGGSVTERLKISSDGIVTKPNTPAFHVSRQGGDVSANNYVTFDHADYNNGSHFNTSNGRFTAPVTGIYFFSAWHFTGGTSAFYLRINGTTYGEYTWDDTGGCGTWVCPMTANQYAQIYTKYTWRGTSDYHNAFCGYLIG